MALFGGSSGLPGLGAGACEGCSLIDDDAWLAMVGLVNARRSQCPLFKEYTSYY